MRRAMVMLVGAALLAGCSSGTGGVTTLAKVDGWRDDVAGSRGAVEIAYDEATARTMWAENVGSDVPQASGTPRRPGIYGDLDRVDFDRKVVVMLSSGESSSCLARLTKVSMVDGVMSVRTNDGTGLFGGACTADYAFYRVIVAVDRDAAPPEAEVAGATVSVDGFTEGALGAYPLAP